MFCDVQSVGNLVRRWRYSPARYCLQGPQFDHLLTVQRLSGLDRQGSVTETDNPFSLFATVKSRVGTSKPSDWPHDVKVLDSISALGSSHANKPFEDCRNRSHFKTGLQERKPDLKMSLPPTRTSNLEVQGSINLSLARFKLYSIKITIVRKLNNWPSLITGWRRTCSRTLTLKRLFQN